MSFYEGVWGVRYKNLKIVTVLWWHLPVTVAECGGEWEVDPTQTSADQDEDEQQVVVGVIVRLDPLAGGEDDDDGDQAGDAHDVQHHAQHRLDHIFADDWGKDLTILNISLTVFGYVDMDVILLVLSINQIPNVTQFCWEGSFNIV